MVMPTSNDGVSLWQDEAKCIGANPDTFFTETDKQANVTKAFCNGCPVKSECLEYALLYNMSGVWGGTTDKERRKVSSLTKRFLIDDAVESGIYNERLRA